VTESDDWIAKVEDDYRGALDLNRRRKEPLPGIVCYLCQQSAEKYLKALLASRGVDPPRIHSLDDLLSACCAYDTSLDACRSSAITLTQYAVNVRYPGSTVAVEDAWEAMTALRAIRRIIRRAFDFPR
jgi:HEPN domain-containing protein